MSFVIIGVVALVVSGLTLFTGFGLGTLLLPAFALLFPVPVAVAATAVVHGANSLFKFALLHRSADRRVIVRFGITAVLSAFAGAWVLSLLSDRDPTRVWHWGAHTAVITPVKLVMGALILIFAIIDLVPATERVRLNARWLPVGGVFSGFFGGLSGHQGALRAAFLGRLNLTPAAFAATQAVLALLVDAARLTVYGVSYYRGRMGGVQGADRWWLVGVATACAFAGAVAGKQLLPKVTIRGMRCLTGALLLVVGMALGLGLV